jgi:hypothetical protein
VLVARSGDRCAFHRSPDHEPGATRITWRCIGRGDDGRRCFQRVKGPRGRCARHRPKSTLREMRAQVEAMREDVDRLADIVQQLRGTL